MKFKYIYILIPLLFIVWGCTQKSTEQARAHVYEAAPSIYGRGYYKLHVFYEFEYHGGTFRVDEKLGQKDIANYNSIKQGDSIIVEFPKSKPQKAKLKKLIKTSEKSR